MLVLSRGVDEDILIGTGENTVVIRVLQIRGDKIRIGIEAPKEVPVFRREVYEEITKQK